ncbi:hypothetical protein [uncultured Thiobacillus sp.]|jgi:hypothetical protein|uniref:hypothetical protein n=1 Tax=uncultured Thiobacillus sp. TaxID=189996 RepID=UPI002602137E|nr:hypothetical protein [uncultured Thiobacillus sp.]
MDMPLTLDWLVAGRERKTRTAICPACGVAFKHGRSWAGPCPACVARALDNENAAGLAVARRLALPAFTMFRRPGDPAIHCQWACQSCGHAERSTLRAMRKMTAWKAACPVCVRGPRYAALAQSRFDNLGRRARRMADALGLEVLEIAKEGDFPEPANTAVIFTCRTCGDQGRRTVQELEQGRSCPCSMPYSRGEAAIAAFLKLNRIPFVREFHLGRLGLPANLRFDFYIAHERLAIEYDGQQHYEPIPYFGGVEGFEVQRMNDRKKDELAALAGVRVLRVPFHCESVSGFLNANLGARYGR